MFSRLLHSGARLSNKFLNRFYSVSLDHTGNTPLHSAVKNATNLQGFKESLQKNGMNSSAKMAKILNNENKLPVDYLDETNLNSTTKEEIRKELISLMKHHDLPKHNELIDTQAILKKYGTTQELKKNIELACKAVNDVRARDVQSSNHPDINDLTLWEKEEISKKIVSEQQAANRAFTFHNNQQTPIELLASITEQYQAGNCESYTALAANYIRKADPNVPGTISAVVGGDHIVGTLGEGESKVIFDALAGKVYPMKNMVEELNTFRNYRGTNVFASFNPNIHSLATQLRFFSTKAKNNAAKSETINEQQRNHSFGKLD